MIENEFVTYSVANRVATIALNSPKTLNALTKVMRLRLIHCVEMAEADPEVRVIVLTGEGRSFCAGADLNEGLGDHDDFVEQCNEEYLPWLMGIHNSSKLYVAAVSGAAAGVACAAVLNCDLVVMSEDAYLYQAFAAIGLMPDGGATWLLLKRLGYHRAIEMVVSAGRLDAAECLRLGLANKVVATESLRTSAQIWAEQLAKGAPLAQAATKKVMRSAYDKSYEDTVIEESVLQSKLIESQDSAKAVQAFLAKEAPTFDGK